MPISHGMAAVTLPSSFGRQNPAGLSASQIPGRQPEPAPARPTQCLVSYFRFQCERFHHPAGRLDIEACPQQRRGFDRRERQKFQGGCTINIDQSSALTINGFSGGNDGGITTLNNYGTFNLAYSKSQGGEGFNVNLGATGVMNLTSSNGNSYNAKIASLTATLTLDGGTASGVTADGHQILTRNLVSLGDNMSFDGTNTSLEMLSGIAGVDTLTAVDDLTNAEVGSYMVTKNGDGYSVSYVVPEPAAASPEPAGPGWSGDAPPPQVTANLDFCFHAAPFRG